MEEYILFIDETLKSSRNPYMCMAGICVRRDYYEDVMTKEVNNLKKKHFSSSDIILHYSEMNNKKGDFKILSDGEIRKRFWYDYSSLIKNSQFVSMGVYFDQQKMNKIYKSQTIKCYNIAFIELIKNYLIYLKSVDGVGSICIESRSFNENSELQRVYYSFLENGSVYFSKSDFEKYLSSLAFIVKGDNCVGLQIADILPSALLRKINDTKDFYNIGEAYRKKLYCYGTENQDILGLKKIF